MNQTVKDYKALISNEIQGIEDDKFLHRVYISVRDYPKGNGIICGGDMNIQHGEQGQEY